MPQTYIQPQFHMVPLQPQQGWPMQMQPVLSAMPQAPGEVPPPPGEENPPLPPEPPPPEEVNTLLM